MKCFAAEEFIGLESKHGGYTLNVMKRISPLRQIVRIIVLLTTAGYGCSAIVLPEYKIQDLSNYEHRQLKDGLEIAIHPLTKREDIEKHFGTNLLSARILPILIIAENRSSDSSYIFYKDHVELVPPKLPPSAGSEPLITDPVSQALTMGAHLSIVGGIGFPPLTAIALPLMLVGGKMSADAKEIEYNLVLRELHSRTISPGASFSGFIYFKMPEKGSLTESWLVRVNFSSSQTRTPLSFEIPFKLKWDGT